MQVPRLRSRPLLGFFVCLALTVAVQEWVRPALRDSELMPLLATAPSFLYALAGVLGVASVVGWPHEWRWWAAPGPLAYELLQPWIQGRTFDPWDVLASIAGSALGLWLTRRRPMRPRLHPPRG